MFLGEKGLQQIVDPNKTLLVNGPASILVVSGRVEIFGHKPKIGAKIVVREGRRLPFFALEKTIFEISLGVGASIQEVIGNTIPESWMDLVRTISEIKQRPFVILVLGQADSGKSSFCTFLVNKLLNEKFKVAVLDGDMGQSDIGPSGTIAFAIASKSVTELIDLKLMNAYFIGTTSPIQAITRTIEGLSIMKAEVLEKLVDFVIVNTDGWVSGDIAVRIKTSILKELKPDFIVGLQVENELEAMISNLKDQINLIAPSPYLSPRTSITRKKLREMTYARYLKHSKLKCYPISHLKIEPKNILPKRQEPEKGLLIGLYGVKKFLGIGVLREINAVRRVLKVQTTVKSAPSRIAIGNVVINQKLQEVQD